MTLGGKCLLLLATALAIAGAQSAGAATAPAAESNSAPVILRGSQPAPQVPAERPACPAGYANDPRYGCMSLGDADEPEGYGYWPYLGFDSGFARASRHAFRRRVLAHHIAPDFHGAAHTGAIGHR